MKNQFYCKFCHQRMIVSYSQYKENMYCNNCLEKRLKLKRHINNRTSLKTFGSYRPLKSHRSAKL